jgi:hypothetical protein
MYKPTLPLVVIFALLLAACTLQITAVEPTPILPTASPVVVWETQVSAQPTQTPFILVPPTISQPTVLPPTVTVAGELLYFWPASPEVNVNVARSSSGAGGYSIWFTNAQSGVSTLLRAGTEADRYPYCAGQTGPYQIRSMEGCYSHGTGAGTSLEWREKGIHYSIGGMENSLETVVQFANNLKVLDYQSWQQKFTNAAKLDSSGQKYVPPTRTRIQFIAGTTSKTTDYRELASGNFDEYILGAMAGQELTVNVEPYTYSDSDIFALAISGADGSMLVSDAAQLHFWTGVLPATQDYVIRVTNRGNASRYRLNVNIPWRIRFAAGATSAALDGRLMAGNGGNSYLLQAGAGQTITVNTTSANNNACLTIGAKMTNGGYQPLVRSVSQSLTSWSAVLPTGPEYSQDYSILVVLCPDASVMDSLYTLFISIVN